MRNCFLRSMNLQVSRASAAASWQQQIVFHGSYRQPWPPPGWSIRRELQERRRGQNGRHFSKKRKVWQNEEGVRMKEEEDAGEEHRYQWRREQIKGKGGRGRAKATDLRRAIPQLRVSGSRRRRGRLSFPSQGETGGWEWHTLLRLRLNPQLKGLWVWTLRRVLAFTRCWGNRGVCQMSAPYP